MLMSIVADYRRSLERSELARTRTDRPSSFAMAGYDWTLLDDVFAPMYSPSTEMFLQLAEFPESGSVLEIGCGCGVIAITAALRGCRRVVAADISRSAVLNTELNIARHGVGDRVRAVESDLFAAMAPGERFDFICWNSNYVLAPEDYQYGHVHERAYVDPGYAAHRRYLIEAPTWTTAGGRAVLGFSSRGDFGLLEQIASENRRSVRVVGTGLAEEADAMVEYKIVEISVTD